ncbi:MAG: hypothetical protein AAGK22_00955 [Acidobacteriota bacterium]
MNRIRPFWIALCLASAASVTLADRVILENGNVLEGRAERRGDEVVLRSALGTLVLQAESVLRIEREASPEAELLEQLQRARTVDELLAVAERCRAAGAGTLARRALERVLLLDPENAEARASLGYRRQEEGWTLEPMAPTAKSKALSRAEVDLVAALLAGAAPTAPSPSQPAVVLAPPLAWPPLAILGGPPPGAAAPRVAPRRTSPATSAAPVSRPAASRAPQLRARRATKSRFSGG